MKRFSLSACQLKLLAMALMLTDHLWATVVPGNMWMTYLGRMAFPIFAFQVAEGYCRTADWKAYARRLLFFALLSEVPFDLMYISGWFFPFHQNVMFTLLLGLLGIRALDTCRTNCSVRNILLTACKVLGVLLLGTLLMVDYSWQGVATVMLFWAARHSRFEKFLQVLFLFLLNQVFFNGHYWEFSLFGHSFMFMTQCFALGALIPSWLYDGRKGYSARCFQLAGYAFYPLHMFLLYALPRLFS